MKFLALFLVAILTLALAGCEEDIITAYPGSVDSVSSQTGRVSEILENKTDSDYISNETVSVPSNPEAVSSRAEAASLGGVKSGVSEQLPEASVASAGVSESTPNTPAVSSSIPFFPVASKHHEGTPSNPLPPVLEDSSPGTVGIIKDELSRLMELRGLTHLTVNQDEKLERAADLRAEEIVTKFSHTRSDGNSFWTIFSEVGYTYRSAGENIAYIERYNFGYTDAELKAAAETLLTNWWNSDGHRKNMQNQGFAKCGLGIYFSASASNSRIVRINATQLFSN